MNKSLKSIMLSCCMLYSVATHKPLAAQQSSTAQTILIGCATVAGCVAASIGLYKFFNWTYYYNTDRTSIKTFIVEFAGQVESVAPYLDDYQLYLNSMSLYNIDRINSASLPVIINSRYPNFEYPTLTYHEALYKFSNNLYYLKEAFERKKNTSNNIDEKDTCDEYISRVRLLKERIDMFKQAVSKSPAYSVEYKAKYPPAPQVVIIHHHDIQK